jgi:hypothetical protein
MDNIDEPPKSEMPPPRSTPSEIKQEPPASAGKTERSPPKQPQVVEPAHAVRAENTPPLAATATTNRPVQTSKPEQFMYTPSSLNDADDAGKAEEEEFSLEINNFDSDDLITSEEAKKTTTASDNDSLQATRHGGKSESAARTELDEPKRSVDKKPESNASAVNNRKERDDDNSRRGGARSTSEQTNVPKSSNNNGGSSSRDSYNSRRPAQQSYQGSGNNNRQQESNGNFSHRQQPTTPNKSSQPQFNQPSGPNSDHSNNRPGSGQIQNLMEKPILPLPSLIQPQFPSQQQKQHLPVMQNNSMPFQPIVPPQQQIIQPQQQQQVPFFNQSNMNQPLIQQFPNQMPFRQQQPQQQNQLPLLNGPMGQIITNMAQTMSQFLSNNINNNTNQFNPNMPGQFQAQNNQQRPLLSLQQQQPLLSQPHNPNQMPSNSFHNPLMGQPSMNPMMQQQQRQQFPAQDPQLNMKPNGQQFQQHHHHNQQQPFNSNMMNANMMGMPGYPNNVDMQHMQQQHPMQMVPTNGPPITHPQHIHHQQQQQQQHTYPNMIMNNQLPIVNHHQQPQQQQHHSLPMPAPSNVPIVAQQQQPPLIQPPAHVFLNPQFITKQQPAQPVSSLPPQPKPTRSRKDLDLLLEQRLAEELANAKDSQPEEKRSGGERKEVKAVKSSERLVEKVMQLD